MLPGRGSVYPRGSPEDLLILPKRLTLLAIAILLTFECMGCSDLGRPFVLAGKWELSSSSLDFGSVALTDSTTRSITVQNTGNADLEGNATVSCPEFRLVSGGGRFRVVPGGEHVVVVGFDPVAEGDFSCVLDLGTGSPPVALQGTGALQSPGAAGTVSVDSLAFGELVIGQSRDLVFNVQSTGSGDLRIDIVSGCSAFEIVSGGGPGVLAPGAQRSVTARFHPNMAGAATCAIAIGPGIPDLKVSGFANTVSFANDVQPIFNRWCISCHGADGGLSLSSSVSYNNLVNKPSHYFFPDDAFILRVKPFSPDSSVLFGKVSSTRFGQRMPPGTQITPTEIEKIRVWIVEGAKRN